MKNYPKTYSVGTETKCCSKFKVPRCIEISQKKNRQSKISKITICNFNLLSTVILSEIIFIRQSVTSRFPYSNNNVKFKPQNTLTETKVQVLPNNIHIKAVSG